MARQKTIAVFGANGRVGSLVVSELLTRGYGVRAFVHGEPRERLTGVTYIQGDVADAAKVAEALTGADAVISALGSWGTPSKDILRTAMKTIVPLLEASDTRRIISLTGADAWTDAQHDFARTGGLRRVFGAMAGKPALMQLASHWAFSQIAGKIIIDGEAHVQTLKDSSLDWTVLRSPVMNEQGAATYKLSGVYPWPWQTINRHAVAQALVAQLESTDFLRASPYISRV